MAQPDYKAVQEFLQGEAKNLQTVADMKQVFTRVGAGQISELKAAVVRSPENLAHVDRLMEHGMTPQRDDSQDPVFAISPSSSEASSVFSPPPNRVSIAPQGGSANSPGVNHPVGTPVAASPPAYSMPSTPAGQGWQFGTPVPSAQRVAPETPENWHRVAPLFEQLMGETPRRRLDSSFAEGQMQESEPFFAQLRQDQQFFQQDTPVRVAVLQQIFDGAAQQVQQAPDTPRHGPNSPEVVSVQSPMTPMPSPNQAARAMMETPGTIARGLGVPLGGLNTQPEPVSYGNRLAMEMQMDEAYDDTSTDREYDVNAAQSGDPTFRERYFGYGTAGAALLGAAMWRMTQEATRVRPQY